MLRSESGIDRQIGLGSDKDTVVVKREQSVKAKPSIYWSIYAPTLTLRFVGSSVYWLKEWNDRYKWQKWVYCEVCSCSALETGQGGATPTHQKESAEVVWVSDQDASWAPPRWDLLNMYRKLWGKLGTRCLDLCLLQLFSVGFKITLIGFIIFEYGFSGFLCFFLFIISVCFVLFTQKLPHVIDW